MKEESGEVRILSLLRPVDVVTGNLPSLLSIERKERETADNEVCQTDLLMMSCFSFYSLVVCFLSKLFLSQ